MKEARKINEFDMDNNSSEVIDITALTNTKSSLNAQYLGEVENIKKNFGSLEEIRFKLGLSKSKIAQLLLVKPATWSRWEKDQSKAPTYIFQALKWYLLLAESNPEMKTKASPDFIYENHLKLIGTELKKIKNDFEFKNEFMHVFQDKITAMISHGLSQIQVKIQPVIGQQNAVIDDSFKLEQLKIQSQVQNVEYLIRQMKEDVTNMKGRDPVYIQTQPQFVPTPQSLSQVEIPNSAAVALKVLLIGIGTVVLATMAYLFVMYA